MRDTIVLAGGYPLETMGASAVRALGMAALLRHLGYRVLVLGKFCIQPGPGDEVEREIDGIPCRDIRQPVPEGIFPSYVQSAVPIMAVVDMLGARRIRAVVAYNYPARGLCGILRGCRARGIAPVLDCTEWYAWEGPKILRNLWRQAGVATRMRLLTRLAGNVICASTWFQRHLPRQHTLLLPFVLDVEQPRWMRAQEAEVEGPAQLVYSGSPGIGLHKDRLPPMIEALSVLAREGHTFHCALAGLTEPEYLAVVPQHRALLSELAGRVYFLGRIPHAASLDLVRQADFSVFFREPSRMSQTGFATKFVEAATLGVPIVSNPTSDIPRYLRDGENGILARGMAPAEVAEALRRAVSLPPEARRAMRAACRAENPFDMHLWARATQEFFDNLRGLA